jgi:hypothetical protein
MIDSSFFAALAQRAFLEPHAQRALRVTREIVLEIARCYLRHACKQHIYANVIASISF